MAQSTTSRFFLKFLKLLDTPCELVCDSRLAPKYELLSGQSSADRKQSGTIWQNETNLSFRDISSSRCLTAFIACLLASSCCMLFASFIDWIIWKSAVCFLNSVSKIVTCAFSVLSCLMALISLLSDELCFKLVPSYFRFNMSDRKYEKVQLIPHEHFG